jgi:hypothetical protein
MQHAVKSTMLMPNAGHQARLKAEARHERTLYAVACMPLFGREPG